MRIRLLAVDLDGTLLRHDKTFHPASTLALQSLARRGVTVVVATGRALPAARSFAVELGLVGPVVGANGADVGHTDGTLWRHDAISPRAAVPLARLALELGCGVAGYEPEGVNLVRRHADEVLDTGRIVRAPTRVVNVDDLERADLSKILVSQEPRVTEPVRAALLAALDPQTLRTTDSEPYFMEFLRPGTSKASALQEVARRLGVPQEETAAIGDYRNDLEMVRWAGVGGAIGNALPEMKAAADLVVGTNEEGGVAEFVDRLGTLL